MSIASSVYGLAERGYLPDFLVRSGIRRLCAETSRGARCGSEQEREARMTE